MAKPFYSDTPPMRAVSRAMSILEAFSIDQPSLPLGQLAEKTGLSDATASRVAKTLMDLGYLLRQSDNAYCLSPKIVDLARRVKSTIGVRDLAKDIMTKVAKQTKESAVLYCIDGDEKIAIEVAVPDAEYTVLLSIGHRGPLGLGASGKALLAYQSPEVIDRQVAKLKSEHGINERKLTRELKLVRKTALASSHDERRSGMSGKAVPIFATDGTVKYTLAMYGPTQRFLAKEDELVSTIFEAGREISRRNGGDRYYPKR